jgi:hypothetical protein
MPCKLQGIDQRGPIDWNALVEDAIVALYHRGKETGQNTSFDLSEPASDAAG